MKFILILTFTFLLVGNVFGQKISQKEVYDTIIAHGLVEPIIVLKQAIHESAHFKSKGARLKNNILGLMRPDGKALRYFESVTDCILFYKEHVQIRYEDGDYYRFLKFIGYATDPKYKKKVENIELDFIIE